MKMLEAPICYLQGVKLVTWNDRVRLAVVVPLGSLIFVVDCANGAIKNMLHIKYARLIA